jgi:LysM repeat protein
MTDSPYDHHRELPAETQPRGRRRHGVEPNIDAGPSEADLDVTAEFWGQAPAWRTTGSTPVTRRGRVAGRERTGSDLSNPEPFTSEPSARWALSSVDPLLVRLGAILAVGVLLVPVALALRTSPEPDTIQTPRALATGGFSLGQSQGVPFDTRAPSTSPTSPAADANSSTSDDGQGADAAVGATAEPRSCEMEYTVSAGDYWLRLVDESGVSLSELLAANRATVDTPLYPGDEICLPAGASPPAPPTTVTPTTVGSASAAPAASRPAASAATPTSPATTAPRPAPTTTTVARPAPTTAAPRPTTTAAPRPAASTESAAQVEAIIREVWPAELQDRAITIARRESSLRPSAYNGWCCYGVFQIYWNVHRDWLSTRGITSSAHLLDARTNIAAAYEMYRRSGGWGPWSQTNY